MALDPAFKSRAFGRAVHEVNFYQQLAIPLHAPCPVLYYATFDPSEQAAIIVMEDIDGAAGDAVAGCNLDHAATVLQALAPFHAAGWPVARSHSSDVTWLPVFGHNIAVRTNRYPEHLTNFLSRFGHKLSRPAVELLDSLDGRLETAITELSSGPMTVLHGDLHLDNIIFCDADDRPTAVLIDWQGATLGPAAIDLTFIVGALEPDVRRHSESRLLHDYFHLLVAHGVRDYDFQALERHYRLAILVGVAGLVSWLGAVDIGEASGRERALMQAVVDRQWSIAAALDHWDARRVTNLATR